MPDGCSLNCGYVGFDEGVREGFVGGLGKGERGNGKGYCVLVRMLHEPVGVKVDRRGGFVYVCDLGGCVYRFRLFVGEGEGGDGEGGRMVRVGERERAWEYDEGCFTGLALAYL